MNYSEKSKIFAEIEKVILQISEVISVYSFLDTFHIHTENFNETENKVKQLFNNIKNNLGLDINYKLIRIYAGELLYKN